MLAGAGYDRLSQLAMQSAVQTGASCHWSYAAGATSWDSHACWLRTCRAWTPANSKST